MDKGEIRAAYDRVAADYDRHYGKPVHKAENTAVSVDLHFLIGKDDTVLDIGSGTGLLLELARLRPKKYLGIDLSPEMCRVAKERHFWHRFSCLDFDGVNTLRGEFVPDRAVSLFESYNYSPDLRKSLVKLMTVVSARAKLYIMLSTWRNRWTTDNHILEHGDDRATEIAASREFYDSARIRKVFDGLPFTLTGIRGFQYSRLPVRLYRFRRLAGFLLWLESRTLGRLDPDNGRYIIVEAET